MSNYFPQNAQTDFAAASSYDENRPSYTTQSVNKLLEELQVTSKPGAKILDLAAGTGKFTELLAAREEKYDVIAVEPHAKMREVLEKKNLQGVKVLDGTATDIKDVEGGWADAVVVAQAFHWFANMEALREIHRVLKPMGILGVIWNIEDYNAPTAWNPTTVWEGKLKEIIWAEEDESPRFRHTKWHDIFEDQLATTPFTVQLADPLFSLPLGYHSDKWTVWLSKDAIWDRFHTLSQISVMEGEKLEETKRKAYEAMGGEDVEVNEKGEIALHGQTPTYWASSIPDVPLGE